MFIIVSYPRSGSVFLLENIEKYEKTIKSPFTILEDGQKYIMVLRNPLDSIVSGIIHNSIRTKTKLLEEDYYPTLDGATNHYIKHLKFYDLSKIFVYSFNDLINKPKKVFSNLVGNFDIPIEYPSGGLENSRGSLTNHPEYIKLYKYAKENPLIFKNANKLYEEALKYRIVVWLYYGKTRKMH